MKRNIFLFVSVLVLSQAGCKKDWLNKKPDISATIPATLADCRALLDKNSLFNLNSPNLQEIASDGHYIIATALAGMSDRVRNAYTWSNDRLYLSSDWLTANNDGPYRIVFTSNLILETLQKMVVTDQNRVEWNNLKGEALFQRSRAFFELAQNYAPQYRSGTAQSDLGIPLRLEADINIPAKRSTLQESYSQIVNDLIVAKDLLLSTTANKARASKHAALALLARVYLNMEDYYNAGIYANSALSISDKLLDFSGLDGSKANPIQQLNIEVIYHSSLINSIEISTRSRIEPALKALYNVDDLRSSIFFGTSAGEITYKGSYTGNALCFNGLATDEMYLIRAECHARAGNSVEAMNDVNTLLKTRWKKVNGISSYINQTAGSAQDALIIVLDERRKELLKRGLRWGDLRRLNLDPRFAVTLKRTVLGIEYTLEPNSYKYTFPIPDDIIKTTGMPQNIGWGR